MRTCLRPATMVGIVALLVLAMVALVVAASPGPSRANPMAAPSPTNVILFIGDGMGPEEMDLARGLNASGELMLDGIDWTGRMTIDSTSLDGVTDSAAAATALATGRETWNGWLSMGPPIENDAYTIFETVLERAEDNCKATGLVSNTSINAATPAAFGAHVPDRDLDLEITEWMAKQDIEALFSGSWSEDELLTELPGVTNVSKLKELKPYLDGKLAWPDKMYGFFGNMAYPLDRDEEEVVRKQPTLAQMTSAAIGVLESDDGFFLMVEQATIDYGGHSRDPGWVGADVNDLDSAVMAAYEWAQEPGNGDTLILVTADHETGGLLLTDPDYDAIGLQTATTEWMWGLIKRNRTAPTVSNVLQEYAGIENLDDWEVDLVLENKEMGISDVLAGRDGVTWGWSGTDEGDHTDTPLEVRAWGPGADAFNVQVQEPPYTDNEYIGQQLLLAVTN